MMNLSHHTGETTAQAAEVEDQALLVVNAAEVVEEAREEMVKMEIVLVVEEEIEVGTVVAEAVVHAAVRSKEVAVDVAAVEKAKVEMVDATDTKERLVRMLTQWIENPELAVEREMNRREDTEKETGDPERTRKLLQLLVPRRKRRKTPMIPLQLKTRLKMLERKRRLRTMSRK